jgi:hypothetical protein
MRFKQILAIMGSILIPGMIWAIAPEEMPARLVRVSLVGGDVTYQRSDLDKWLELGMNTPLFEGDKIWSGTGGRVEIEFDDGSNIRLADNTILEIARLGAFGDTPQIEIYLNRGLANFKIAETNGSFIIEAPLFSLRVQQAARLRLEVAPDDSGKIIVLDGKAEVKSQQTNLILSKGESVNLLSQDPDRYYLGLYTSTDDWDRWNDDRDEYLNNLGEWLAAGFTPGWNYSDLNRYGSWEYAADYGRVWKPRIAADWSPYTEGRWTWYPGYEWTWVSSEPWGWIPYHYGRWAYASGLGWCWVPGPGNQLWCPGAVGWIEGSNWIAWVPLAPSEPWIHAGHHPSGNTFIPEHWRNNRGAHCVERNSFATGQLNRIQQVTRQDRGQARILPGPPDLRPTLLSRMPVVSSINQSKRFNNDDLESRRLVRESWGQKNSRGSGTPANDEAASPSGRSNRQVTIISNAPQEHRGGTGEPSQPGTSLSSSSTPPKQGQITHISEPEVGGLRSTRSENSKSSGTPRQRWADDYLKPVTPQGALPGNESSIRTTATPGGNGNTEYRSPTRWADNSPTNPRESTSSPASSARSSPIDRSRSAPSPTPPPAPPPHQTVTPQPVVPNHEGSGPKIEERSNAANSEAGRSAPRGR